MEFEVLQNSWKDMEDTVNQFLTSVGEPPDKTDAIAVLQCVNNFANQYDVTIFKLLELTPCSKLLRII